MRDPFGQYPAQMVLSEDEDMVQALPAEAAEEPFTDRVQVGRLRRNGDDIDPCAVRSRGEVVPELTVVVANQEPRSLVVRRRLAQLLGHPGIGGGSGSR